MKLITLALIFAFAFSCTLTHYRDPYFSRSKPSVGRSEVKYAGQPPHLLWPNPIEYTYGSKQITIEDPCNFSFDTPIVALHPEVSEVFNAYKEYMFSAACSIHSRAKKVSTSNTNSVLVVHINDTDSLLMNLNTDESYTLEVKDGSLMINATSYPGALRALETFSQLIQTTSDPRTGKTIFVIPATPVFISDAPRFKHRGFMLDTSRHFISKSKIFSLMDGMMFTKLNVFHWHLVDSDSFPFYFPSHPNLTLYGAFSAKQVYSQQDIEDIVQYAILRGIRIIPELDSPAHVAGWAYAPEGQSLINCTQDGVVGALNLGDETLGVPVGQISPIMNETYDLLQDLLNDLNNYFPWEFVHLGADEVLPYCWNNTEIYQFMSDNNIADFSGLFNYYVNRERGLVNSTKTRMYWTNPATDYLVFQPDEILQWWGDTSDLENFFEVYPNNKFVLSNYDYLYYDCGFGDPLGGESWCDPLHTWWQIAGFPLNDTQMEAHMDQILGIEAALWSELNSDAMVLGRAFPRAASLGEKAWSPESEVISNQLSVATRLNAWVSRNNDRGIPTGPITTGYCEMDPVKCFS